MNKYLQLIKEDYTYIFYLLVVFAIPITFKFQPVVMALWVLIGILSIKRMDIQDYQNYLLLFFPVMYFLIHAIGITYSDDVSAGFSNLEAKLAILFIPLVSLFLSKKIKINYMLILKVFVLANLVASIICLLHAALNTIEINEEGKIILEFSAWPTDIKGFSFFELVNMRYNKFSYGFLSFIHHPTYFSLYILFSIVTLVYLVRKESRYKVLYVLCIAYFAVFIWLLASRAAYISFMVIAGFYFIRMGIKYNLKWMILGFVLLIAISSVIVLTNTQIKKNIKEAVHISSDEELTKNSDIRLWIWKASLEIWNENVLFGVGIGDADSYYTQKYQEYNLKEAVDKEYNAHNQFFDEGVKLGLLGMLVLAAWFIYTLYYSYKNNNFLLFYFILIFVINFMFEVLLNRIAAVSFFAVFYSLLVARSIKKN